MNTTSHTGRIDTRMHRPVLMEVECDDFPESYQAHPETRQPVSCPPRARKVPTSLIGPLLGVLSLLVVAMLAALALVWPA
jgi:hypothetical protein